MRYAFLLCLDEVAFDASADPPRVTRVSIVDPSTTPPQVLLQLDDTQFVFHL